MPRDGLPRFRGKLATIFRYYYEGMCCYDRRRATRLTLQDALEGHRNLAEAEEDARAALGRPVYCYTAPGFPLHAQSVLAAVRVARAHPELSPIPAAKEGE